jgi:hypothetical protein
LRGAATALAVIFALNAHAQEPPDTPPAPPAQAPASSTPSPADAAAGQAQPPAESPPPAETPAPPVPQPRETPPTPRASAPRALTPQPQPAPPAAAADHEGELATLRAEVSRLQAELDAERAAAALPAVEEGNAMPAPVRSAWEWVLAAALLALAAGFVLGWRVLDRRIRRKYGGLRIY